MKNHNKIKLADILLKCNIKRDNPEKEEARIKENENLIDEKLNELEEYIRRELTGEEEDDILEIVDEFTPVGENGKYLVDLLPFDYAWTIYEARKNQELESFLGNLEVDN